MLTANNVCFGYEKKTILFGKIKSQRRSGDKIGIIGKKTVWEKQHSLRLLRTNSFPDSGNIKMKSTVEYGYFSQNKCRFTQSQ